MKTLDRAPPMPESECNDVRRPRRKRPRPFKIERRYIGDDALSRRWRRFYNPEWHVCGAYETERGQRDAFRSLTTKGDWASTRFEYRIAAPVASDASF